MQLIELLPRDGAVGIVEKFLPELILRAPGIAQAAEDHGEGKVISGGRGSRFDGSMDAGEGLVVPPLFPVTKPKAHQGIGVGRILVCGALK